MKNRNQTILFVIFAVATVGIGCGTMDVADVQSLGDTASGISDAAEAAAPLAPSNVSPTIRLIQIITQSLSALAYGYLGWRLKQDSKKEE